MSNQQRERGNVLGMHASSAGIVTVIMYRPSSATLFSDHERITMSMFTFADNTVATIELDADKPDWAGHFLAAIEHLYGHEQD